MEVVISGMRYITNKMMFLLDRRKMMNRTEIMICKLRVWYYGALPKIKQWFYLNIICLFKK